VLMPYDLLRLRQGLGMASEEFIERYTDPAPHHNGWPLARLKMREDGEGTCPFLGPEGCTVYPHRPSACRMYPLARATRIEQGAIAERFYLVREAHCKGHGQGRSWAAQEWMADQGLEPYNAMAEAFMPLLARPAPDPTSPGGEQKLKMFFMACYNTDAFRQFVMCSSLAKRLELGPGELELLATNDQQLLRFAFKWLRLALLGEPTLRIKR